MVSTYPFIQHSQGETPHKKIAYTFKSVGTGGIITKIVEFELINEEHLHLYNCAFGDFDEATKRIRDQVVSNNGDFYKVMHTVVKIIFDLLTKNEQRVVYIFGTDRRRLAIYQRIMHNYWPTARSQYALYGGYHWLKDQVFRIIDDISIYDFYLLGHKEVIKALKD
ncbi:MAG: hypothetical protein ACFB0B_11745 [Thermonemataceae bacterium]